MHFATLTSEDVVRHSLVAKIVDAYSKYEDKKTAAANAKNKAR
jgi:phosphate starvation-inducible PhoH-like protein